MHRDWRVLCACVQSNPTPSLALWLSPSRGVRARCGKYALVKLQLYESETSVQRF